MAKKKQPNDEAAAIKDVIAANPTWSDDRVAAEAGADRSHVTDVRSQMGAKHTWKGADA